jgi:hypothetical protein
VCGLELAGKGHHVVTKIFLRGGAKANQTHFLGKQSMQYTSCVHAGLRPRPPGLGLWCCCPNHGQCLPLPETTEVVCAAAVA